MYVKLNANEIDELIRHVADACDVGDGDTDGTELIVSIMEKLKIARALAPVCGESFIDPNSPAAGLLLASAGIRATVTSVRQNGSHDDDVDLDDSDDAPRQNWPTTRPSFLNTPFGWEQQGEELVVCKREQDVIKAALKAHKKGWTYQQIADDLNGRHLRTRRGSRWNAQTVRHLLTRSVKHKQNKGLVAQYS